MGGMGDDEIEDEDDVVNTKEKEDETGEKQKDNLDDLDKDA